MSGLIRSRSGAPRIALFTHDTFGLGHVRRCLHIIEALAERAPRAAILFITGSPAVGVLGGLPRNADFVKIPTIARTGSEGSRPPHLPIALDEVTRLRQRLIEEAVLSFAPDVFLVDNFPTGSRRELLPALDALRRGSARTALGLRDVLDAPEVVRADWTRRGTYEVLKRCYDRILVYGMPGLFDIAQVYALAPEVAAKVHYCGYVTATAPPRPAREVRAELELDGPFLLATGGGGGDAFPLLSTVLDAVPLLRGLPAVIVTGPLMGAGERAALRARAAGEAVRVLDYTPDLRSLLAAAEVVVSMCGYNIAAEIAAVRARAVVVPRTWRYGEHANRASAGVEWEQRLRAQALARLGFVDVLEPNELTPQRLAARVEAARRRARAAPERTLELGGVDAVAGHLLDLAGERAEAVGAEG